MKNNLLKGLVLVFLMGSLVAKADMTLEIVTQGAQMTPIAVLPFAGDGMGNHDLSDVVAADLKRSGLFDTLDTHGEIPAPADVDAVKWDQWQSQNARYVVVGNVQEDAASHHVKLNFRLVELPSRMAHLSLTFEGSAEQYRFVAHHAADAILENITGYRGMFSSRIAYITQHGSARSLKVADSDGFAEQSMLNAQEPILSPRWSPDGQRMAYVTFELNRPMVVVQTLATGSRHVVARYKGSNSAPAWTPDGRHLAVVLTKDGHSQIYRIAASGQGVPERLLISEGIDTEPYFSPDGQMLYFVSDRDGGPQIYRIPMNNLQGAPERLTFGTTYAVSPRLSPDGQQLAYIQRDGGAFHVMLMDLATRQAQPMTDTTLDESPTFAPNGKYLLYSTRMDGRGQLGMVSTDGRIRQKLSTRTGDVYEPVWGPLQ
ncbi:MAG: Tol-Pal system beta propeller repeat protein TolB [Betaproteobacteria bacterium]|jgi:tol-pal system beta propeller repeat protein TolB|nr:Tol-Pal system beta propeller repeat protein TolB [Betaproteobacteria bacterium]